MNMKIPDIDFYRLLCVDHTATPEEIRLAYRRLVPRFHEDTAEPHLIGYAHEVTVQLNEAAEWLLDPEKRPVYDSHRISGKLKPSALDGFREKFSGLADTSRRNLEERVHKADEGAVNRGKGILHELKERAINMYKGVPAKPESAVINFYV